MLVISNLTSYNFLKNFLSCNCRLYFLANTYLNSQKKISYWNVSHVSIFHCDTEIYTWKHTFHFTYKHRNPLCKAICFQTHLQILIGEWILCIFSHLYFCSSSVIITITFINLVHQIFWAYNNSYILRIQIYARKITCSLTELMFYCWKWIIK